MSSPRKIGATAVLLVALSGLMILWTPSRSGDVEVTAPAGETKQVIDSGVANVVAEPTATPTPAPETVRATPVPPTPTPTPEPRQITMSFSGDILSHSSVYVQARSLGGPELEYDYRPLFREVASHLTAADLAICVLETPVSSDNTGLSGYPTFNAPRELPDALAEVGFDGCATASNHSFDRGVTGVTSTLDQMDRVGLGHAGMARSEEEQQSIRVYNNNDVVVAHLSYTYGLNGYVLPTGEPWWVNVTDVDQILAQASQAREGGADLVVLSIQWGNEYVTEPTANQLELAEALTASPDIDLIVGNHAHVIQPIDIVNDTPIIYGLGNFLSNQSADCCPARSQDGVMIEVTLREADNDVWSLDDLVAVPTWVDRSTYTIIPLADALEDVSLPAATRETYSTSYDRTMATLTSLNIEVTGE